MKSSSIVCNDEEFQRFDAVAVGTSFYFRGYRFNKSGKKTACVVKSDPQYFKDDDIIWQKHKKLYFRDAPLRSYFEYRGSHFIKDSGSNAFVLHTEEITFKKSDRIYVFNV